MKQCMQHMQHSFTFDGRSICPRKNVSNATIMKFTPPAKSVNLSIWKIAAMMKNTTCMDTVTIALIAKWSSSNTFTAIISPPRARTHSLVTHKRKICRCTQAKRKLRWQIFLVDYFVAFRFHTSPLLAVQNLFPICIISCALPSRFPRPFRAFTTQYWKHDNFLVCTPHSNEIDCEQFSCFSLPHTKSDPKHIQMHDDITKWTFLRPSRIDSTSNRCCKFNEMEIFFAEKMNFLPIRCCWWCCCCQAVAGRQWVLYKCHWDFSSLRRPCPLSEDFLAFRFSPQKHLHREQRQPSIEWFVVCFDCFSHWVFPVRAKPLKSTHVRATWDGCDWATNTTQNLFQIKTHRLPRLHHV